MSDATKKSFSDILRAETASREEMTAFERWILPTMDEDVIEQEFAIASPDAPRPTPPKSAEPDEGDIPEEETVQPLTAEEVEAIRQAAYDDGFMQGQADGYDQGRKKGYDEGYASGEADIRQAVIRLSQVCRTLFDAIPPQDNALEQVLCQLLTTLTTQVVRRELRLDSSGVRTVVREALKCITPGSQRIRVHLNPDDIALVESLMSDAIPWEAHWRLLPHRSISPGGCIIDTDESVVDARAEKRLSIVLQQMYTKEAHSLEQDVSASDSVSQLMDEVPGFAEPEVDTEPDDDVTTESTSEPQPASATEPGSPPMSGTSTPPDSIPLMPDSGGADEPSPGE